MGRNADSYSDMVRPHWCSWLDLLNQGIQQVGSHLVPCRVNLYRLSYDSCQLSLVCKRTPPRETPRTRTKDNTLDPWTAHWPCRDLMDDGGMGLRFAPKLGSVAGDMRNSRWAQIHSVQDFI